MNRHEAVLNKIAERTGTDDPCRGLVLAAREALASGAGVDPRLLSLLLAIKAQLEEDAVVSDQAYGWCRTLPRLIAQNAMPAAYNQLVAYMEENGHV